MTTARLFHGRWLTVRSAAERAAHGLALAGLYLLAISVDLSTAGASLAMAALALASVLAAPAIWADLRGLRLFWVIVALTAYVVVHSLVMISVYPSLADNSNPHWTDVARVTGFTSVLIGWWMARDRGHVPILLALVAVSLFVNRLVEVDITTVLADGFAHRNDWGSASVRVGHMAATGVVLCAAAVVGAAGRAESTPSRWQRWVLAAAIPGFLVFSLVLYGSQTRGAWLGTLVACLFLAALAGLRWMRSGGRAGRPGWIVVLLCTPVVAVLVLDDGGILERRVTSHSAALDAIVSLDREALYEADRSMGRRVNMWVASLEALKERPWFGFGAGGKAVLAERTELDVGPASGHVHNLYIELLHSLGVIGFLGFVVVYAGLFRAFAGSWRGRIIPDGVGLIGAAFWIMTLLTLLTDVRIGHSTSRTLLIFMTALLCYAWLMRRRRPSGTAGSPGPPDA